MNEERAEKKSYKIKLVYKINEKHKRKKDFFFSFLFYNKKAHNICRKIAQKKRKETKKSTMTSKHIFNVFVIFF